MLANRKWLIVLASLAAVSFAGSFVVAYRTGAARPAGAGASSPDGPTTAPAEVTAELAGVLAGSPGLRTREKYLDDLIRDYRFKLEALERHQQEMEKKEQRLRISEEALKKQLQELEALRVELVAPLAQLKEAQAELQRTRVLIAEQEKANLKKTALIYEKMDAAAGGKILAGMCANKQEDDAVKILHYMVDRSAAKLLAEITDEALAARLCGKLKLIREEG